MKIPIYILIRDLITEDDNMEGNSIVAYFSCSGVTAKVAKNLAEAIGADIYEIKPKVPYTAADLDWYDGDSRTSVESRDANIRPELAEKPDVSAYDNIYLGFPMWWYEAPRIIATFLESCDLSGKTVIPFFTSGGSEACETQPKLERLCPSDVKWKPIARFYDSTSAADLKSWADGL